MTYYTQNRLITAEDYQIGHSTISTRNCKSKICKQSIFRIIKDILICVIPQENTQKTNLFGSDGILFRQYYDNKKQFLFETRTDIEGVIVNDISPILGSQKTKDFYFDNITQVPYTDLGIEWVQVSQDTNILYRLFQNQSLIKQVLGRFTTSILSFSKNNSPVKFRAPDGMHFDKDGELATGAAVGAGTATYKWVKIVSVYEDGTENTTDGLGPVIINDYIPNGSLIMEIRPFVSANVSNDVKSQIVDQIFAYKAFGLRYDRDAMAWKIILEENLDVVNPFPNR